VLGSIARAGVPEDLRRVVLEHVKEKLVDTITTTEIYRHILDCFDETDNLYSKARYSLKQAIMLLGPTGYPFEDYVSRILEAKGYQTEVRQLLMGACVGHEVDVISEKNHIRSMIEAKFHNNPGVRSDVQVALYTKSRFEDLKVKHHLDEAWIVTNTKATTDAIAYANCVGMRVLSWSYPENESLRDLIEETKMHPVTVLTSLSLAQKRTLLNNHIVTCLEILRKPTVLHVLFLGEKERKEVMEEVRYICSVKESEH
jgi:Holliday junction resolvase-like predicted endonuclease